MHKTRLNHRVATMTIQTVDPILTPIQIPIQTQITILVPMRITTQTMTVQTMVIQAVTVTKDLHTVLQQVVALAVQVEDMHPTNLAAITQETQVIIILVVVVSTIPETPDRWRLLLHTLRIPLGTKLQVKHMILPGTTEQKIRHITEVDTKALMVLHAGNVMHHHLKSVNNTVMSKHVKKMRQDRNW